MSTNVVATEPIPDGPDAAVSSELISDRDIAVGNSLDSKTETLTAGSASGGSIVHDLVDEIGTVKSVMDDAGMVLAGSSSDAVMDGDVTAVNVVKDGDEMLDSNNENLTVRLADHDDGGDAVVQGSIDVARVSGDGIGTVMDELSSDAAMDGDVTAVNDVKDGDELLDSRNENLTVRLADHDGSDTVVHGSVDVARVSGDEIGTVMDELSSDAAMDGDVTVVKDVKDGDELLDSKNENLTVKLADHDGGGGVVQGSIDDARVSGDEIGAVMDGADKVLAKSSSDAAMDGDVTAVNDVKNGAELLGSRNEILTMKASDYEESDTVVQDSIDDSMVSGEEIGAVMAAAAGDDDSTLAELNSDAVMDGDNTAVDDAKTGAELLDSKNETVTMKSSGHEGGDTVVLGSVDDSSISEYEIGTVTVDVDKVLAESNSDAVMDVDITAAGNVKIGAELLDSKDETLTMKSSDNEGGDTVVQDSIDAAMVSGDEKGTVTEKIEKVSDENEVDNEEKEGEYKVTDLVWAKVKDYPWWPGQILDPSSSTDTARKYSNKKAFLVGYFGDQSFAWNKAPKIKPFRKNFTKLERQSNSEPFFRAVNCALEEVSRRVEFGLACSCLSKEVYTIIKTQVFVNDGIKEEASRIDGSDRFSVVSTFKPVKIVQSVQDLAREHFDGYSKLEALSVRAQLASFFRWNGYYQLQPQSLIDEFDNKLEDESELSLKEESKVVEDVKPASASKKVSSKKRKADDSDSDGSAPRKKQRSLTDLTPKSNSSLKRNKKGSSVGKKVSSKKRKADDSDSDDSAPRKKQRSLTDLTPKSNSSLKRNKKDSTKKPASVGKKVSCKKRKADDSDS